VVMNAPFFAPGSEHVCVHVLVEKVQARKATTKRNNHFMELHCYTFTECLAGDEAFQFQILRAVVIAR